MNIAATTTRDNIVAAPTAAAPPLASSESVDTASNPRKLTAARDSAPNTSAGDTVAGFQSGASDRCAPATPCFNATRPRTTKAARNTSWMINSSLLKLAVVWMPNRLIAVLTPSKPTTQTGLGICGITTLMATAQLT